MSTNKNKRIPAIPPLADDDQKILLGICVYICMCTHIFYTNAIMLITAVFAFSLKILQTCLHISKLQCCSALCG